MGKEISCRILQTQLSSAVVLARDRYSASVEDRATVHCFFALLDIRLGPRKTQKPLVDLLSTGQPTQSASDHAVRH